ncbi:MAG TPA: FAD-binding oxidoreductase [Gammaproteobacteria bacterium]|nr:FAD-binding oxidoreductase [Gammaproteobacteria bacterium]MEC8010410.1 FAD-binding oxidoreductase [Pseudomonadota bacterium]HBF09423.1 FAD-binding oxidoreductase [Gammaproteobacteria bacterium]HCK94561.1 FAD-binding oxidoreductase [Gammaproteobacteria bacterium]|tara:strand:+ start:823 stop:2145 length:1323 start_codon:yes stop_codon:yes gene_type:complete
MAQNLAWGRLFQWHQPVTSLSWRTSTLPALAEDQHSYLPYGLGRSYGDSCLNKDGVLVSSKQLTRFIHFDSKTGLLEVEAGVTLKQILEFAVPRGWFLPVTPGTKNVTYGGAVANDVHGKNHHSAGTFGCHTPWFYLLRSDGQYLKCSTLDNVDLYKATIGGLGLTGFITAGAIQLKKIRTPWMDVDSFRYKNFDEFCELSKRAADEYEYTVAWVDALAKGDKLGQGLFLAANHRDLPHSSGQDPYANQAPKLSIPVEFPNIALNPLSIKAFNFLYLNQQRTPYKQSVQHYNPYFYPLDGIGTWNKIYGRRGFYQYQCAVPSEPEIMREIMTKIAHSDGGSFLTVLKEFGDIQSPGMLSFPMEGFTFALDFPNKGGETLKLLNELDALVRDAKGRVYPAKDARMSAESFATFYPNWEHFSQFIDPAFSSSFWRRVTGTSA